MRCGVEASDVTFGMFSGAASNLGARNFSRVSSNFLPPQLAVLKFPVLRNVVAFLGE